MKVGDRIWRFDINRRIYRRDENNRATGGPIYREHFNPEIITGETNLSWLIQRSDGSVLAKINKKTLQTASGGFGRTSFFTDEGMEDEIWRNAHRYKISRLLDRASAAQLRECAKILDFKEDAA